MSITSRITDHGSRLLAPLFRRSPGGVLVWVAVVATAPWRVVLGVIASPAEEERNRQLAEEWFSGKVTLLTVLIVNRDGRTFHFYPNLRPPGRQCLGVRLRRGRNHIANRYDAEWLNLVNGITDPAVRQRFALEDPIEIPPHSQRTCLFGFAESFHHDEMVSVTLDIQDVFGLVLEPKEPLLPPVSPEPGSRPFDGSGP